jgi:hypothetical protein
VTQQQAPAGWYDDPAGSGGKRFWNGRTWTERVEGGSPSLDGQRLEGSPQRTRAQGRIPDGYMLLNGQHVRIGAGLPQQPRRNVKVSGLALAAVLVAIVLAVLAGLAGGADTSGSGEAPVNETSLEEDWETVP